MSEESNQQAERGDSQFPGPASPFAIRTPNAGPGANSPFAITCPFCGGGEVELFSLFGSQLLTSEYYCRNCRTVFEYVKR
jgi:hypothetical protein